MILTSIVLLPSHASSDPTVVDNPDGTNTIVWDYDDPSNYTLTTAQISDGKVSLPLMNVSAGDDTAAEYNLGTKTNIDTTGYPGSVVLDETYQLMTVTMQPGPEGVDAYLSEDKDTDNYATEYTFRLDSEINKRLHPILRFDLAEVPADAVVVSASLSLYEVSGGKGGSVEFSICGLNKAWVESEATWTRASTTELWATPGGDFLTWTAGKWTIDNTAGWRVMDVTNLVDSWVSGESANFGLILVPTTQGGDNLKLFQSSDQSSAQTIAPKLTVQYLLPGSVGLLESRVMGPGTNATFTLATWNNWTQSLLDDGFSGSLLSDRWNWTNDPLLLGGSYNVGLTRPGWLHVVGSANSQNINSNLNSNFLHQYVTGDFVASTSLEDGFSVSSMGAGLLLAESNQSWISVAKGDPSASGKILVTACVNGTSIQVANVPWTGMSAAYLKMERNSTGVWIYAGTNETNLILIYHHSPWNPMQRSLSVGLFTYSASSTKPTVDFDLFTVQQPEQLPLDVRVRVGNSTSLTHPSWSGWSAVSPMTSPCVLGRTGMYVQYRVYFESWAAWYSPAFSDFECWYECHAASGIAETKDFTPSDFSRWYTLTTSEDSSGGTVQYYYSTNHGSTWVFVGTGGSYSITSTEGSLKVRAVLGSWDTLRSPEAYSISATYGRALSHMYVVAPSVVTAGKTFPMTIYAKDSSNTTMVHWTGAVTLEAINVPGMDLTGEFLAIGTAYITTGGYVTVPNQMYTVAETIIIRTTTESSYGFSDTITVLPGAISEVTIDPIVEDIVEETTEEFTAHAYDTYGNEVANASFSWSVDPQVGSLDTYTGASVELTTGAAGSQGYLTVTCSDVTMSMLIAVEYVLNAPVFTDDVPTQVRQEDSGLWSLDIGPYIEDQRHPDSELRWFVTNESVVSVSGENRTGDLVITFSTKPDVFGTNNLNLYVVDPAGLSAKTTLQVQITPVNDGPTIELIDALVVHYDSWYWYNMKYYVHDVDNTEDELVLQVNDDSSPYVSAERLVLYFNYPEALNGTTQNVIVTVSDGHLSSSTVILVTITDDNVPVSTEALPSIEMFQGESVIDAFDLDDFFIDPDDEMLYFAYGYEHVLITISSDNQVSFHAPLTWYGLEYVIFRATDPRGARTESVAAVTVHQVNQPPVIEGVPDLTVCYDLRYEFDLTWYVSDPDDDAGELGVTTNDIHVVPAGLVLSMLYPESMHGQAVYLNITVSDGNLSDSCVIRVVIGNNPPPSISPLPKHTFQEDTPLSYPIGGDLRNYFIDDEELVFEVFPRADQFTTVPVQDDDGDWIVDFTTDEDWYGQTWFMVRATKPNGALAETMVELTVVSVPDAPTLGFNTSFEAPVGVRVAVDLTYYADDVDSALSTLAFSVSGDGAEYVTVIAGVMIMEFPETMLVHSQNSRTVQLNIIVMDDDGMYDSDELMVVIVSNSIKLTDSPWLMLAMLLMGGSALGFFVFAMSRRRSPFVIHDLMLIHNDGFLIGRAAEKQAGEIDEDVMSGMLTAVLNFVEDSMSESQDGLKSFGFEHYKVLVKRGNMTYLAAVYEGDTPEKVEDRFGEFLAKFEKIYRKRIENWTGDMETDFVGVELLLQGFLKENSKKAKNGLGDKGIAFKRKARKQKPETSAK